MSREATELASGKNTLDDDQCETVERAAKRQKIEMVRRTRQNRQGRQNGSCTPEYAVGQSNGKKEIE